MFKSSFKIVFSSLFLILAACGTPPLEEPLTREEQTYVGEFTSLGTVKVSPLVTHLFETEEGEILYAYSERYDLSEYSQPIEAYGIVSTYADQDKGIFEIKRLSEPELIDDPEDEEVTEVEYRNLQMGAMTTIYSNWKVEENSPNWVTFVLPNPVEDPLDLELETNSVETEVVLQDTIDWVLLEANLAKTSEDSQEDRANEIRSYILSNYSDLNMIEGEITAVGPDQLLGLRYKTSTGDVFVFIPRGKDLFEISYHHLSLDDELRMEHTNAFSSVLNRFRFIPEEGVGAGEDDSSAELPEDGPLVTQVSISQYSTFSSSSFGFGMSYPASWYYIGGSTGYSFDNKAIEDINASALLRLNFNASTEEGTIRSGTSVSVTRKVDSRYYTMVGPAEYETVIQMMLDSIQTTIAE